jgi:radical SAM-linked protein
MSFAPALPVGIESECELVDVELSGCPDPSEAGARVRDALPSCLALVACALVPQGGPSLSMLIQAVSYEVDFEREDAGAWGGHIEAAVEGILRARAVPVFRATPKGTKEVDLRPLIYDLKFFRGDVTDRVCILVGEGPDRHVRPGDIVREIQRRAASGRAVRPARIVRKEFFMRRDGALCPVL